MSDQPMGLVERLRNGGQPDLAHMADGLVIVVADVLREVAGPGKPYCGDSYLPPHFVEALQHAYDVATGVKT